MLFSGEPTAEHEKGRYPNKEEETEELQFESHVHEPCRAVWDGNAPQKSW